MTKKKKLSNVDQMSPPANHECCFLKLLLFFSVVIICQSSNTALISAAVITRLPGYEGTLPFYLETGYITVDEENGAELFYYFIESEANPSEDPLILWLTGGPGCSAWCGLVFEIGPLRFVSEEYDGSLPKLVYHPYTWTKSANIIFLDSPVGAGFSFSRNSQDYDVGDISSSKQAHKFLLQWFIDHPQFQKNEFYVAGDSYAGKITPVVAQEVAKGTEARITPVINFKGYIIGNPFTGDKIDVNSRIPYAYGAGIISHEFFELANAKCQGQDYRNPRTSDCASCFDALEKAISEISIGNILEPKCALDSTKSEDINQNRRILKEKYMGLVTRPPIPELNCRSYDYYLSYIWANSDVTREALNIKKGTKGEWERCASNFPYTQDIASSIPIQFNLTNRGYRTLVYSGDHDMIIPFLGTYAWIRSLNFTVIDEWRSWHVGGQVAGYTTTHSNNLTFATVKGGSHTPSDNRPKECLAMFQRWISHKPL